MFVTLVSAHVVPEHLDEFVDALRANHEASIREPACVRFDILQSPEDRTRFLLYEAFVDEAGAAAHKETSHYLHFRDLVADWMVEPRSGVRWTGLYPEVPTDR